MLYNQYVPGIRNQKWEKHENPILTTVARNTTTISVCALAAGHEVDTAWQPAVYVAYFVLCMHT